MSPITIRTLRPADLDPLRWVIYRAYYQVLLELYGRDSAGQYEVRSLDFMAIYLRRDAAGCFVAETEDGSLAGGLFCFVWGEVGWFGSLAVAPEWQGRGLAQQLTSRAVDYLRVRGCRRIGLETWPSAPRTRHLYTKLGFELGRPTVKLARAPGRPAAQSPGWSVEWAATGDPDGLGSALAVVGNVGDQLSRPAATGTTFRVTSTPPAPISGDAGMRPPLPIDPPSSQPAVPIAVDYRAEVRVPVASGYAEVAVLRTSGGAPMGFALCYTRKPSGAPATALDVRLLTLVPDAPENALDALLAACDRRAVERHAQNVTYDVNTRYSRATSLLRARGFRPIYELVRMEQPAPGIDLTASSPLIECARWAG